MVQQVKRQLGQAVLLEARSMGAGRGSEQPKSPEEGPKKKEAEEKEENLEETPKRPKINFDDRRVAGPLRIAKGRMGPASSEESQEGDVELEGLLFFFEALSSLNLAFFSSNLLFSLGGSSILLRLTSGYSSSCSSLMKVFSLLLIGAA